MTPPDMPVAHLPTINLDRLRCGISEESKRLFEACRTHGFFYLDLQSSDTSVLSLLNQMYDLTKELYDMPEEEKLLYDVDTISEMKSNGYKPVGRNFGGLAGRRDGFETYAIPKNGIMALSNEQDFRRPAVVDKYMQVLQQFTQLITGSSSLIMERLSQSLELPETQSLDKFHRPMVPSPDIVRLLKYHAQPAGEHGVPHAPHTDLGSLTFVFTKQPGLQTYAADANEWRWVLPREGHAIVNLGDSMSLLVNGALKSCLHRVGPPPGQSMPTRYSFAYLVRPEDHTPMGGLQSPLIPPRKEDESAYTSAEWLRKKYGVLRLETRPNNQDWVMTGRRGEIPIS